MSTRTAVGHDEPDDEGTRRQAIMYAELAVDHLRKDELDFAAQFFRLAQGVLAGMLAQRETMGD